MPMWVRRTMSTIALLVAITIATLVVVDGYREYRCEYEAEEKELNHHYDWTKGCRLEVNGEWRDASTVLRLTL